MDLMINGRLVMRLSDSAGYSTLSSKYSGCHIDVGVDQSKTHTAIMVGPAGSGYSDYIEILCGSDEEVFELCAFTRYALKDLFKGSIIRLVGIEDPITKTYRYKGRDGKYHESKGAMDTHEKRLMLSAVFSNFMFIFRDLAGKHPIRVNNEAWKGAVLPEEYRKRSHDKGSLDWHKDRNTYLANTNDNVTDAACILDYIRLIHKSDDVLKTIDTGEVPEGAYRYIIRDYKQGIRGNLFQFNPQLSFTDNVCFVRNRLVDGVGIIVTPTDCVPITEFYKESCELHTGDASSVFVFVGGA